MNLFKVVLSIGAATVGGPAGVVFAAGLLAHSIHETEKAMAERNSSVDAEADKHLKNGCDLIESEFKSSREYLHNEYKKYLERLSANQKNLTTVLGEFEQEIKRAGICIRGLPNLFGAMLELANTIPNNRQGTIDSDLLAFLKNHRGQISFLFNWSILQIALLCQDHGSSKMIISEMVGSIDFTAMDDKGNSLLQLIMISDNMDLLNIAMQSKSFRHKQKCFNELKVKYAGVPLSGVDQNGRTTLTGLMQEPEINQCKIIDLLFLGASIFEVDAHQRDMLQYVIRRGVYELTFSILSNGFSHINKIYEAIDNYINVYYPSGINNNIAILQARVSAFKKLSALGFGADIYGRSIVTGYTALSMAVLTGEYDFVKTLLDAKFDPNIPTINGILPIEFAYKFNNHKLVELLKSYGAKNPSKDSPLFFQSFVDTDVKSVRDEYIKEIFVKAIMMGLPIDTFEDMWILSPVGKYHPSLPLPKKYDRGEITILRSRNEPADIQVKSTELGKTFIYQSHVPIKNIFPQDLDIGMNESLALYGHQQITRFNTVFGMGGIIRLSFTVDAKINSQRINFYGYDLPFLDSEFHAFNISRGNATELLVLEVQDSNDITPLVESLIVHRVGCILNSPGNEFYRSTDCNYINSLLNQKILVSELIDLVIRQFATPCNPANRLSYYKANHELGIPAGGTAIALAICLKKNLRIWRQGDDGLELDFEYKIEQGYIPVDYETVDILNKSLSPDTLEDCALLSFYNDTIRLVPSHVDLINNRTEISIIYKSWLRYIGNKSKLELSDDPALRILAAQCELQGLDCSPEDISKHYYKLKYDSKVEFLKNVELQPDLLDMAYRRLRALSRDIQLRPYVDDIKSNLANSNIIINELLSNLDHQLQNVKNDLFDEMQNISQEKSRAEESYVFANESLEKTRENNKVLLQEEINKFKNEEHKKTSDMRHKGHAGAIASFAVSQVLPSMCESFKIKDIYQAGLGSAIGSAAHGDSFKDILKNTSSAMLGVYLRENFNLSNVKSKRINNIVSGMVQGFCEAIITGKNRKEILRYTAVGGINNIVKDNMSKKEINLIEYAIHSSIEKGLDGLKYSNNSSGILENMVVGAITPYVLLAASTVFPKPKLNPTSVNTLDNSASHVAPVNDDVASPSILDEQFLAKPGFEYTQPNAVAADRLHPVRTQGHESSDDDWTKPDSYSVENLQKSVDEFLRDPVNRATRDNRPVAKDIALNVVGGVAGILQAAIGDTLEFTDATELLSMMATGTSRYGGRKLQTTVEETGQALSNLRTNGPMPLVTAYKSHYKAQMDESLRYAKNHDPFMAGFDSARARTRVAMDAASLIGLGGWVVKAGPMLNRLGGMGATGSRAANAMVAGLEGPVNPSFLRRSTSAPGYNSKRAIANDIGHVNTGARSYNPAKHGFDEEAWAAPIYNEIRSWNGPENIAIISKNTGIPEQMIASVRQHVFFNEHRISKVNRETGMMTIVTERFSPDAEIASLWDLASSKPISGTDLIKFERFIAHEYVERGLMNIGYPYRSFDSRAIEFVRGDFRLGFNRNYYGAHDMAPLSDYLVQPWQHHKVIGNFEPLPKITNQTKFKVTD